MLQRTTAVSVEHVYTGEWSARRALIEHIITNEDVQQPKHSVTWGRVCQSQTSSLSHMDYCIKYDSVHHGQWHTQVTRNPLTQSPPWSTAAKISINPEHFPNFVHNFLNHPVTYWQTEYAGTEITPTPHPGRVHPAPPVPQTLPPIPNPSLLVETSVHS